MEQVEGSLLVVAASSESRTHPEMGTGALSHHGGVPARTIRSGGTGRQAASVGKG